MPRFIREEDTDIELPAWAPAYLEAFQRFSAGDEHAYDEMQTILHENGIKNAPGVNSLHDILTGNA